jgi:NADPH:quinone reductase-like Zn-dependent oxidoreductase
MKAVRFHEYGDPSVLRYEEVDRPVPGPGQVLVQVAAAGFNPLDATMRAGYVQGEFPLRLPFTPGFDVAGVVAELGDGASGLDVGDPVVGSLPLTEGGAAAEFSLAPAEVLTAAPTGIPLVEAAALPSASLTAWQALFEHAELRAGQRVLINGAGGGVGGFAVQLAKEAGAFVIATASPRSAEAVGAAGADQIVDYTRTTVTEALSEPVDVVLNLVPAAGDDLAALVALVKPGGIIVSTTGPVDGDAEREVRSASLFVRSEREQLAGLVDRVDAGRLRIDVGARYPLAELAEVHAKAADGALRGRVVVTAGG